MVIWKTNKLPHTRMTIPIGTFLVILQFCFQNKHWTPPNTRTSLVPMIGLSFDEYLHWRNYWFLIWCYIEHPNWVLDGKGPKCEIINPSICPIQWLINHKSPGHIHNGLDGALHSWILMMNSNTSKDLILDLSLTILAIRVFHKNSIITVIMRGFCNWFFP